MVVMKRQHSCYALIFILLLFLLCLLFSPLRPQSLVATPDPKDILETETAEMKRITFPLSQGRALSFLTGGDGPLTFLLVHGASREHQNAEHWTPHLPFLSRFGRVFAADMLGHGLSTPGASDPLQRTVPFEEQVDSLARFVNEHILKNQQQQEDSNNKLVIFGRSYGGRVVLELANRLPAGACNGIVLIAPAVVDTKPLQKSVHETPLLVFWAKDDEMVPYEGRKGLLDPFKHKKWVVWDRVVPSGTPQWQAHIPENLMVDEFQSAVEQWLQQNKLLL